MSALVGFDNYREIAGIGHNGGPSVVPAVQSYETRWYQEEAIQALFNFFDEHGGTNPDGTPVRANPLICLPTGTGKSIVIAEFIRRAMLMHPGTRILMSTHVKELIKQNAEKLRSIWPLAPLGIYSAGLGQRDFQLPIVFGGVQSLIKIASSIGFRDLLVIDEAHLIGDEGNYTKLINILTNMQDMNPYLKVIGLTATPYRLGLGHMTNGSIFTHTAYDLCNVEGFNRLMAEGFLSPLIAQPTQITLDVSKVGKVGNDFNQGQLEAAVDDERVTFAALKECCEKAYDRATWLIFASGIKHARHIQEMLNNYFNIPCGIVHSNTKDFPRSDAENEEDFQAWRVGKLRAIVNMNSLTTGVDHPPVDFIAMLRPTMSPGLWVQMLGRGTRPFNWFKLSPKDQEELAYYHGYVKQNCLCLDFAGNTRRLGPINDPLIPRPKGKGPPGDAPVKICDSCGSYNHASARICILCGEEFKFQEKLNRQSSGLELLRSDQQQIEDYPVTHMVLAAHDSKHSGRSSIRVAYFCGLRTFYEYVSVESPSAYFRHKSRDWFRQRYHYSTPQYTWDEDVPKTNQEVLDLAHELRKPKKISVWVNKQQPEITGYEF